MVCSEWRSEKSSQWSSETATRTLLEWREALGLGEAQPYRSGRSLFSVGAPNHDVFLVDKGIVGLYHARGNDEALTMLAYPGHIINLSGPELQTACPASGVALTACTAHRLSAERLKQPQQYDLRVTYLFQQALQAQIVRRTSALAEILMLSPAERLEQYLCELARVVGEREKSDSTRFIIPLKDEDLAMLIGVSDRQFSRVKKALQLNGRVLFQAHHIVVLRDHY